MSSEAGSGRSSYATVRGASRHGARRWQVIAGIESVAAAITILLDLLVPTLILLAMAAVSLLARRQRLGTLGLHRRGALRLVPAMLAFAVVWSLFQLAVTMPIANHLSGGEQDLSAFDGLEGNLRMLVGLLVLSWTLAALGEELAYRGYLMTRLRQAIGGGRPGIVVGLLVSAVLFGIAHTEQGAIGIVVVTLDGMAWGLLRLRYRTLWAPVLAHGFNNTLGFVAFYLIGPVHGFW